ncbi:PAS domain-containing hybrid sensor histidine kinase/response regulator [Paraferrimonas sedimenticola]|uniref:histidine kinase n=1 Tax=Paraferrimonas sedimenticola TaxID=375674 RepID=A0AA37RZ52_9GAMM|nr:NahK/ErcS family hybrid sensor histidine kinase/response regulator [Paraferrimonas sedimenticola]GLP97868.1 sensor histidine kinase [Paraferrimonas sedimenticola]
MNLSLVAVVIALLYVSLLFILAWGAERWFSGARRKLRPSIYVLSLAVYCSSWSFLGTVGSAADNLWSFVPIYLSPILIFGLAFPVLMKMVRVSKAQNITSVADFIAARYGKSQGLAAVVTLIALFGIMPYIALQIKAMVFSFGLFQSESETGSGNTMALVISLTLALFAILFGTRKLDATEHNPGMILAIGFESIVKLLAFLLVGLVITWQVFDGPSDFFAQASANPDWSTLHWNSFAPELIVSCAAFLCMPRMFHVMMVECESEKDLVRARWQFPLYLILFAAFIAPLALAGRQVFGVAVDADTYVINLPLHFDSPWLAMIALLGTISAATGMVIVAVVTISIMISNEWLLPLLLKSGKLKNRNYAQFSQLLLNTRRVAILLILLLGYFAYVSLTDTGSLAKLGMLSFGAFAQLAPALIGGMIWTQGNRAGVFLGLTVGFGIWLTILLEPLTATQLIGDYQLPLLAQLTPQIRDVLLALCANLVCYVLGSLWFRASVAERIQASSFVFPERSKKSNHGKIIVSQQDLLILASRFIGPERAYERFTQFAPESVSSDTWHKAASPELINHTEHLISAVLGTSSTRLVMQSVLDGRDLALDEVFSIVDEASTKIILSQDMLRGAIEHAYEGMSVVDKDLRLVAWNYRYQELYQYPENFLQAGMPVAEIIRFNAKRGFCGPGEVEEHVSRRVQHMRNGTPHSSERQRNDGTVIKISGNPMPDGGFVMTFTDITQYRQQAQALQEANDNLEARVKERTKELALLNARLLESKVKEEQANATKSKFLAAVGHDLMQPLNAARLFTASLGQDKQLPVGLETTVDHINNSLRAAGELLTDLLDISRFDSGKVEINRKAFVLNELLSELAVEFNAMAEDQGTQFSWQGSQQVVDSDINLLRRILQNFLTNAFRYAKGQRVLLGVRRSGDKLSLQVWDTGCGIEPNQCQQIFDEFWRSDSGKKTSSQGLGLGLAIAKRIGKVMEHPLAVRSWYGMGSVFSVEVPLAKEVKAQPKAVQPSLLQPLAGVKVLCIDNEEAILAGYESLLSRWKCDVICATSLADARIKLGLKGVAPEIVLADYQLDDDENGLDAMVSIREAYGAQLPGILITANTSKRLVEEVEQLGFKYMAKMVRPAALRALMSSMLTTNQH